MKTYFSKNARLLAILFCLLCSACGTPVDIDETATPPPATPGPKIHNYEGVAVFNGGAGNYVVACDNCSATVINTVVCQATIHDGTNGNDIGTDVIPVITVSHDGEIMNQNSISTPNGSGLWVIKNQIIPYKREQERPENLKCHSDAEFTVLMNNGGIVTELP